MKNYNISFLILSPGALDRRLKFEVGPDWVPILRWRTWTSEIWSFFSTTDYTVIAPANACAHFVANPVFHGDKFPSPEETKIYGTHMDGRLATFPTTEFPMHSSTTRATCKTNLCTHMQLYRVQHMFLDLVNCSPHF